MADWAGASEKPHWSATWTGSEYQRQPLNIQTAYIYVSDPTRALQSPLITRTHAGSLKAA